MQVICERSHPQANRAIASVLNFRSTWASVRSLILKFRHTHLLK
ncbi:MULTISPECIES: hypothetical protein [Cyanophyceae]|nr:hypothetical protein [Trichocoleus sp. FACHB-69]